MFSIIWNIQLKRSVKPSRRETILFSVQAEFRSAGTIMSKMLLLLRGLSSCSGKSGKNRGNLYSSAAARTTSPVPDVVMTLSST